MHWFPLLSLFPNFSSNWGLQERERALFCKLVHVRFSYFHHPMNMCGLTSKTKPTHCLMHVQKSVLAHHYYHLFLFFLDPFVLDVIVGHMNHNRQTKLSCFNWTFNPYCITHSFVGWTGFSKPLKPSSHMSQTSVSGIWSKRTNKDQEDHSLLPASVTLILFNLTATTPT